MGTFINDILSVKYNELFGIENEGEWKWKKKNELNGIKVTRNNRPLSLWFRLGMSLIFEMEHRK